ncbi:hypothetical protein AVEN_13815-1 [Araneus ventricosus]|uniref:Uncharacterized protein n=1 Tax=Araneus ventricosus TaxID=182803 RepID=A0A4Y2VMP9_ARAVE|nr:hypothetical protein AVEN_13815-1 [Araneus ventricosus]
MSVIIACTRPFQQVGDMTYSKEAFTLPGTFSIYTDMGALETLVHLKLQLTLLLRNSLSFTPETENKIFYPVGSPATCIFPWVADTAAKAASVISTTHFPIRSHKEIPFNLYSLIMAGIVGSTDQLHSINHCRVAQLSQCGCLVLN